jgi:hypothetical protein
VAAPPRAAGDERDDGGVGAGIVVGRFLLLAFALAAACGVGSAARAQLQDENLLVTMPGGFKVGMNESRKGLIMQEWVPAGETVQNWTEMVTVQIFLNRADIDPTQFLGLMEKQWAGACKGSTASPPTVGKVNGYAAAMSLLRCPLLAQTGKPETTMFRAIKGNDSFYLVQRAVRAVPDEARLQQMRRYLETVSLCDSRRPARSCPKVAPTK